MVMADGEQLHEADLPEEILETGAGGAGGQSIPTGLTMDDLERLAIQSALERFDGNRTHAADALQISVRTLQRKLATYESMGKPINISKG